MNKKIHVPARINTKVIEEARKRSKRMDLTLARYIEKAIELFNKESSIEK